MRKYTWNNPPLVGREKGGSSSFLSSVSDMANFFLVKPGTAMNKKKTSSGSEFCGLF